MYVNKWTELSFSQYRDKEEIKETSIVQRSLFIE